MIAGADLLSPSGPLDTSLFPGEASNVVEVRIQKYLDEAYNDPRVVIQLDAGRKDNLARNYALWRAFDAVYLRMTSQPIALAITDKGSHGFSNEQIRNMKQLADKYLADFNGLLVVSSDTASRGLPGTVSIRNTVEW